MVSRTVTEFKKKKKVIAFITKDLCEKQQFCVTH